ncbi:unnamed protein product [Lymnaea stagnalis]|uniref:Uncharacterized protein n=1 Tax=Lymnaea stagnalis TaxID=6523 RepID=A0AAV2HXL5_LYMST
MKSSFLLTFIVVCNLCWLVTSLPAYSELSEREIGEALATDVERALETLDQVLNQVNRETSPERRDWWGNVWNNVKDYWKTNKNEIITTTAQILLGKRHPVFLSSDVNRPLLGSLE